MTPAPVTPVPIFLGKTKSFPNSEQVIPVNLAKGTVSRKAFMQDVLVSFRSQWARLLFTGKGKPPKEYRNPQDVINLVSQTQQAIGYVVGDRVEQKGINVLMKITVPI